MALAYFPGAITEMVQSSGEAGKLTWYRHETIRVGGYESSKAFYAAKITFTTPEYPFNYAGVKFRIRTPSSLTDEATFKYALCHSDSNDVLYMDTLDDVDDTNQLSSGVVAATDILWHYEPDIRDPVYGDIIHGESYGEFTVTCDSGGTILSPSTTYYLYLWASEVISAIDDGNGGYTTGLAPAETEITGYEIVPELDWQYGYASKAFAGAEAGFVFIEGSADFDAHQVFIDDGSKYHQYIAYRDTGTDWEMCS